MLKMSNIETFQFAQKVLNFSDGIPAKHWSESYSNHLINSQILLGTTTDS